MKEQIIPILDCSELFSPREAENDARNSSKIFAKKLGEGIDQIGLVYLINHGLDGKTVSDMFAKQTEFFDLPGSTKEKYRIKNIVESYNGFTPFLAENVTNVNQSKVHSEDLRECYDFTLPKKTFIYPVEVKNWEPVIDQFTSKLTELAKMLFRSFAVHLNIEDEEKFVNMHRAMDGSADTNNCHIRCSNYFPPDPKLDLGQDPIRLAAHRDISTLTFLLQDSVGGLEVQLPSGEWIPAPAIPGAIILNSGFMMEMFSGGHLKAVNHRVRLLEEKSNQTRQSLVFFVLPDHSTMCNSVVPKKSTWKPLYPYVETDCYREYHKKFLRKYQNDLNETKNSA